MNAPTASPAPDRPAALAPPTPLAPLGGAVVDGASATFSWGGVPDATRYRLQVAPDPQFARGVLDLDAGPSTQFALPDRLPLGQPLFWRVRAETPRGTTPWSPYGRFVPGTDDAADAPRAQREAAEGATRNLLPFYERDSAIPSDTEAAGVGIAMILSLFLIAVAVALVTLMATA